MSKSKLNNKTLPLFERIPSLYLVLGIILLSITHFTFSIDFIAWFSMVPFLIYLQKVKGRKSRLMFSLALLIAWTLSMSKIISEPIPMAMVFMYSIPFTLLYLPGYLIAAKYANKAFGFFVFPAIMTLLEWLLYSFTPIGSWSIVAYTQDDNLIMMQLVSVFGLAGLSFLIYSVNSAIAFYIIKGKKAAKELKLITSVLLICILFGGLRFQISKLNNYKSVKIAAVGTDCEAGGLPLPTKERTERDIKGVLDRTIKAADFGAEIIVWNEAGLLLSEENEAYWLDSFSKIAKQKSCILVASYVKPVSLDPLKYENKYVMFNNNGDSITNYLKHEPVPGEPAIRGKEPFQISTYNNIRLGGAICYDYDFPYIAKSYGKLDADIIALPSSDWKGIDPIHTKMAAFRAVEQGHSIIRSTRFGLSAAISPYGEMLSQMSAFNSDTKIMIGELPIKGTITIYRVIGDLFVGLIALYLLVFFINIRTRFIKDKTNP